MYDAISLHLKFLFMEVVRRLGCCDVLQSNFIVLRQDNCKYYLHILYEKEENLCFKPSWYLIKDLLPLKFQDFELFITFDIELYSQVFT